MPWTSSKLPSTRLSILIFASRRQPARPVNIRYGRLDDLVGLVLAAAGLAPGVGLAGVARLARLTLAGDAAWP